MQPIALLVKLFLARLVFATVWNNEREKFMKLLRKLVVAIVVAIVVIAIAPLEVFAYDSFNDFPNQTLREWPTKDDIVK